MTETRKAFEKTYTVQDCVIYNAEADKYWLNTKTPRTTYRSPLQLVHEAGIKYEAFKHGIE